MDTQEKPKRKFYQKWWFWVIVVIIVLAAIGSSDKNSGKSVPAQSDAVTSTPAPTQAASAQQTLLDIAGSGTKTTAKFTAANDWDLNWSYDCSNFGYKGNFVVMVYNGDGTLSFENNGVNQLGDSGKDVEHYHKGGTYYLVVNSECKWKVNVQG